MPLHSTQVRKVGEGKAMREPLSNAMHARSRCPSCSSGDRDQGEATWTTERNVV